MHQSGPMSITEAVFALCSMQSTLDGIFVEENLVTSKGKQPCSPSNPRKQDGSGSKQLGKTAWEPPPAGWTKIDVDGSYVAQTGEASVGVVARDSEGQVVFTAWRVLFRC